MEQEVFNFARFFAGLTNIKFGDDQGKKEFIKKLVEQYTNGRTDELKYVSWGEYKQMCEAIERLCGAVKKEYGTSELKRWRSTVLHLMQTMGIDTANWGAVDAYCKDPRIAGKRFCKLTADELESLSVKLRMIQRKD